MSTIQKFENNQIDEIIPDTEKSIYIPILLDSNITPSSTKRTINMTITTPSGKRKTIECVGDCINCVITSISKNGCIVSEIT